MAAEETGTGGGPTGGVPAGVGKTALGVAMIRAIESRRPGRLFHDPYAAAFLAAAPTVFDRGQDSAAAQAGGLASRGAAFWSHVVLRTRFFDDYLLAATRRDIRQVVLVAAGLDTRAYRLDWPAGVRLFEVDLPGVLDFKQRVLGGQGAVPRCDRRVVAADLREDWTASLVDVGFRPDHPTAWLPEGLLMYLSADETTHLLASIGAVSAAHSRMAIEHEQVDTLLAQAQRMPAIAEYAALWKGGLPDAPGWLASHGWRIETHNRAEVNALYGRASARATVGGFVTGTRA